MKSISIDQSRLQTFAHNGNDYNYITVKDLLKYGLKGGVSTIRNTSMLNVGLAFDIETTKIDKYSFMYVWQFAIDAYTVIGRTWEDFVSLLKYLSKYLGLNEKRTGIIWVHNFSFEFSYIKHWIEWDMDKNGKPRIFAISNTNIVTANAYGFQFRDSLVLTRKKLANVAKDYKTGIEKLVGDLDYTLNVSRETLLTNQQLAYCINDVQILQRWFHTYIVQEFLYKGRKIPLTSTGIVRDDMKRRFGALDKDTRDAWRSRVRRGYPNREDYEIIMQYLFRGGYVHCNSVFSGELETRPMGSNDLKSSYPAQLLQHNYPYRFIQKDVSFFETIKHDRKWQQENAFYGCFKITGLRARTAHTLESINKIYSHEGRLIIDNGRLARTERGGSITVLLTEIDWQLYQLFYDMDKVECLSLRIASKHPLPDWLKDMILDYFAHKETLEKDTLDYILNKGNLNSIYGMMVTSIYDKILSYNDETGNFDEVDKNKSWQELIKSQLLLPWFGIWCTAYGRMAVGSTLIKLGCDGRYGDTDSCKYTNIIQNDYIFRCYNDRILRINKHMYVGDHDRNLFLKLGQFDYEGKSYRFATNGAKRYIHTDIHRDKKTGKYGLKDVVTIAGLPKGALINKALNEKKSVYDLFTNGMTLDLLESDKMTAHREDQPFTLESVDYLGNPYTVTERSCVTLIDIPFKMTITPEYLKYRMDNKNKLIVGNRTASD